MPMFFVCYILLLFMCIVKDSLEIQNVRLILPSIVQAGTSATLLCLYDLEGAALYSVQWYRGQFEFFRFMPKENPPTKVFKIPGLNVDVLASNEHQVTIRNIPVQISGEFSCEVTIDAPPFSTSCVSNNLSVINFELDFRIPKRVYRFGEVIHANCTLTPKLPSTKLIFHWNGKPVSENFISHNVSNSVLLHLNTSFFDIRQPFSVMVQLRCSTLLDDMYYIVSKSNSLKMWPSSLATNVKCSKLGFNLILIFSILITTDLKFWPLIIPIYQTEIFLRYFINSLNKDLYSFKILKAIYE